MGPEPSLVAGEELEHTQQQHLGTVLRHRCSKAQHQNDGGESLLEYERHDLCCAIQASSINRNGQRQVERQVERQVGRQVEEVMALNWN